MKDSKLVQHLLDGQTLAGYGITMDSHVKEATGITAGQLEIL
jgi:hypothetical protein